MEAAAVAVSLIAIGIAILGWREARRSAMAAEESARSAAEVTKIEAERRHEEQAPDFHIEGHEIEDSLVTFHILNRGPSPSYQVTIEALADSVVQAVRLGETKAVSNQQLDLGVVQIGSAVFFYGNTSAGSDGQQRFLVRFTENGRAWSRYTECRIVWLPRVEFI